MRRNSNGFTLVEVLIATLIMVMSIVTVTAAIRQFSINRVKLRSYEQLYTTVLSLRDRIMNETLPDHGKESGTLNGLSYNYESEMVQSSSNYVVTEAGGGNTGPFIVSLHKVTLVVEGRTVEFYKTQYKKRYPGQDDL